jgi:hypothetical protein
VERGKNGASPGAGEKAEREAGDVNTANGRPKLKVQIEQQAHCIVFLAFELFLQLDFDILTPCMLRSQRALPNNEGWIHEEKR